MLILSRKWHEAVHLKVGGILIRVSVVEICGDKVRLGFDAPEEVKICRPDANNKEPRERSP